MMRLRIKDLKDRLAVTGNQEAYDEALSKGKVAGEMLEMSANDYREMLAKYQPQTTSVSSSVACCSSMPSVITQVGNAAKAAARVVSASFTGNQVKATEDVVEKRKAICQGCEFLQNDRCSKCGCRYKLKIQLATESCPISKW
jgi:hypothetical protein